MAQNNDLINRGKAIKDLRAIKDMLVAAGDPFLASVINRAIGCIENQPAVEIAEAEPGQWLNMETDPVCSVCGKYAVNDKFATQYYLFCPHCGAPMRGDDHARG